MLNICLKVINMTCIMLKSNKEWSWYSFVLDNILYYHYQRILLDCLRYVGFEAFCKTLAGDLLKISIKRAWVTSVLNIMSSRMSLYSRNKLLIINEIKHNMRSVSIILYIEPVQTFHITFCIRSLYRSKIIKIYINLSDYLIWIL